MRRGELLSLRWRDIDFATMTAQILITKADTRVGIPLTPLAAKTLQDLPQHGERVFQVTANAVRLLGSDFDHDLAWPICRSTISDMKPFRVFLKLDFPCLKSR